MGGEQAFEIIRKGKMKIKIKYQVQCTINHAQLYNILGFRKVFSYWIMSVSVLNVYVIMKSLSSILNLKNHNPYRLLVMSPSHSQIKPKSLFISPASRVELVW